MCNNVIIPCSAYCAVGFMKSFLGIWMIRVLRKASGKFLDCVLCNCAWIWLVYCVQYMDGECVMSSVRMFSVFCPVYGWLVYSGWTNRPNGSGAA